MSLQFTISQSPKLSIEAELDPVTHSATLTLRGHLDEAADLQKSVAYLSKLGKEVKHVSLELQGISNINSSGLRSWFKFVESLTKAELKISFASLSEIFLDRAQSFPNILGPKGTPVISFEAPYFCSTCNTRKGVTLKTKDIDQSKIPLTPPKMKCERCSGTLAFDENPENYFRFLNRTV